MIYTLTLNPALDYVMFTEKLKTDDINRADKTEIHFGGKGINVSAVLNELEAENIALGFVGGFTGDKLIRILEGAGIRTSFTKLKCGETRINVKIRTKSEIDINAEGPEITKEDISALFEKLSLLQNGDFLVLAGSVPKGCEGIYDEIMNRLSDRNIHFIVDTSGSQLISSLSHRPFLIKPNHHELAELFGEDYMTESRIKEAAEKLQALGARNVLVSRAENGALLLDENGVFHESVNAEGTLINSVGCGDSMVAGFLAGYIETEDYGYALKLGTACGNATAYSVTLGTKDEIKRYMKT